MRKYAILVFVLVFMASVSCERLFPTKIGDIRSDPRKYAGKEVTVSGRVTEVLSLIAFKYFVLRDNTGEITVITSKPLPATGQKLTVRGMVREMFSLGDQTALVIMEDRE
jgi:aspartyl/asparaginyl-tRNA synthetase